MKSLESYSTTSLIGWQGIPRKLSVSDNNRLAIAIGDTASFSDRYIGSTYVFDMNSTKLIGTISEKQFLHPMIMDQTGSFLANRSTLYRVTQDSIFEIGPIGLGHFWTNNTGTFWIELTSMGFAIKKCTDLTEVDQIETGGSAVYDFSIDPITNSLAWRTDEYYGEYHIYDLESGIEIKQLLSGLYTEYSLILINSTIFYGEGWYYSLPSR